MINPFEIKCPLKIRVADNINSAYYWRDKGFTPVECSFGGKSVVNELELDHHGQFAQREGVAIRSYRDYFGLLKDKPNFVVTGFPDEDATFSICALAGIIPHPSYADKYPDAPEDFQIVAQTDLTSVALLINDVDLDPNLALELIDTHIGRLVLSWRQQGHRNCRDELAWYGAVDRWRTVLTAQSRDYINAALESQVSDLERVAKARHVEISPRVVVVDFSGFGPNSAYYRVWLKKYPVLVAFIGGVSGLGTCSFAVRETDAAERLFGPRGLMEIYPKLLPGRCGGREIIGGSSRTTYVTWPEAVRYGEQLEMLSRAESRQ